MSSLTASQPVRRALRSTGVLVLSLGLTVGVLTLVSALMDSGA